MKDFSVAVFLETITPYLVSIASKLVAALLILIIGFKLAKIVVRAFGKSKAIAKLDAGVASFLQNFSESIDFSHRCRTHRHSHDLFYHDFRLRCRSCRSILAGKPFQCGRRHLDFGMQALCHR